MRLTSNSNNSLPFAGRCAYRADTIADVLTVKSISDWKVRIGGNWSNLPWLAYRALRLCGAGERAWARRPPLTGNELYLNGLNSGTMPSHAALANAGKIAGPPARPAKRAKRVMPTMGEINTRRSGRDSLSSPMESSAYIKANAPPLEKPTRCNGADGPTRLRASRTASRVAA